MGIRELNCSISGLVIEFGEPFYYWKEEKILLTLPSTPTFIERNCLIWV